MHSSSHIKFQRNKLLCSIHSAKAVQHISEHRPYVILASAPPKDKFLVYTTRSSASRENPWIVRVAGDKVRSSSEELCVFWEFMHLRYQPPSKGAQPLYLTVHVNHWEEEKVIGLLWIGLAVFGNYRSR